MSNPVDRIDYRGLLKEATLELREMRARYEALQRARTEPIAIVGMACRFPGADDPEAFWRLLRDGTDAIREVPPERWDVDAYYDPDPGTPGRMYTRQGGFLDGIDRFDAAFFEIAPREAARVDPQQRLLLEVAWEALERAGRAPDQLAGTETGVFVGISNSDYAQLCIGGGDPTRIDAYLPTGTMFSVAAGRLSYVLGLHGPCIAVDTACSSSLVAIHLACQSLRSGECRVALAGGVNLITSPLSTIAVSQLRMMAPDGRCKTFDAAADGYVRGEGCGILVLERLSDALANRSPILAVVRGSAVNHDGRSGGLTAPNGPAQEAVIRRALANGGVSPAEVSYVEVHGTGTSLGDPVEVGALRAALRHGRSPEQPLWLGSVKTNLGHLESAAGIAGLMKVALAFQHREIPPHLHLKELSPHITLDDIPASVPTQRTAWEVSVGRRIAGVSSFGFGGTNAHAVLEEAPAPAEEAPPAERPPHLLCLSAKQPEALEALALRYAAHLDQHPAERLPDICHTAGVGRAHFAQRLAIVADTRQEMREALDAFARGALGAGAARGEAPIDGPARVVFLFSGHGSQWAGMGRALLDEEPAFRRALEACDAVIQREAGFSVVAEICADARSARLDPIDVGQPALFALQVALAALWRSWGVEPWAILGHGVGEVAAAHVAGALTLEDAARIVCRWSRLLRKVSGKDATILPELPMETRGPLGVELSAALRGIAPKRASLSMRSTVTGEIAHGEELGAEYWARSLCGPLLLARATHALIEAGSAVFLEVSPHPILAPAIDEALREKKRRGAVIASLRRHAEERRSLLQALGALYAHGGVVAFQQLYPEGRVVVLPTYPWLRERYWVDVERSSGGPSGSQGAGEGSPFLQQMWRRAEPQAAPEVPASKGSWLLLSDEAGLANEVQSLLEARGETVVRAGLRGPEQGDDSGYTLDPAAPASFDSLLRDAFPGGAPRRGVIHLGSLDGPAPASLTAASLDAAQTRGAGCALHIVQALVRAGYRDMPRLFLVARGTQAIDGEPRDVAVAHAPLWGLGRTVALEHPELRCTRIDLDPAGSAGEAEALVREILSERWEEEVALRAERRYVGALSRVSDEEVRGAERDSARPAVRGGATYLITGGVGGLGLLAARWLADAGAKHLVLVGRQGVTTEAQAAAIAALESAGVEVTVARADVADPAELAALVRDVRARMPELRGVLHAAGVLEDGLLINQDMERFRKVFAPKVLGAWNLHAATQDAPLDFFVLYSSSASLFGPPGIGNYVAANVFLDALAHHRRHRGLPALSINWGLFAGVGMGITAEREGRMTQRGWRSITPEEGEALFHRLLSVDRAQMGVVHFDARHWVDLHPLVASSERLSSIVDEARAAAAVARAAAPRLAALVRALREAAPDERRRRVEKLVREQVAAVLRIDGARIDARAPFRTLGFDSIMGLELRNGLESGLGLTLSAALIWTYPTVAALSEQLAVELDPVDSPSQDAKAGPVDGSPPAGVALEVHASDDDLLAAFDASMSRIERGRKE
ncbi:type I polyketide synthase [Sorangium sp. So ce321]|uniref:type I polyketide synthase n=1 Tax=Sorangium sp. So ce321 TaxID=3133300 RepID=UPI003F62D4BF